ncbi:SAM-dependent methyltransferase [Alteromonas oceanisediminis]|uniref:SAM-dependent methyltransferase n=1 Tax=Alteromonas oceanisediminis TaxID=2836180 RepID=UPI001BDAF67F|nr:SAM-dependent methyltransferase [Alteromonas oceanisediminis]MBT0587677.1 SAM-dependent methyltransferase [Alteromonas oceanisediminis]
MHSQARAVTTTQLAPHEKVAELALRYRDSHTHKPVSEHTQNAFGEVSDWLGDWRGELIIDACCGVGESTAKIARLYPDARIIGIDKSAARLNKHDHYATTAQNYCTVRADVIDFWHLAVQHKWRTTRQFLLYPNPYPKPAQLQKRWHASSSLPHIVALGGEIRVRSNWLLYLQEFGIALSVYDKPSCISKIDNQAPLTPFERKYQESQQDCWELRAALN